MKIGLKLFFSAGCYYWLDDTTSGSGLDLFLGPMFILAMVVHFIYSAVVWSRYWGNWSENLHRWIEGGDWFSQNKQKKIVFYRNKRDFEYLATEERICPSFCFSCAEHTPCTFLWITENYSLNINCMFIFGMILFVKIVFFVGYNRLKGILQVFEAPNLKDETYISYILKEKEYYCLILL